MWWIVGVALAVVFLVACVVLGMLRGPYDAGEELPWTEEEMYP
jgi:hypothetical protein